MNKQQMLNGMTEEQFYNLYPTEEDYVMAMGGQAGNDDFYVPHQDADRLRATTPINFINTPYYQEGGTWGGTYRNPQYFIDKPGALKKAGSAARTSKDVKIVPEKNPMRKDAELSNDEIVNFARNRMADASQPYNFRKTMEGYDLLSATDRDKVTNLMKTEAFTNLMQEDFERRKKQGWFETYPERKARTEVVYNLGGPSDGPLGYFQEGGNPSPMNYGAFPVMVGGGEFTMIINDLLKKQFGGTDTKNPAPSTDSVIDDKKNFFNAYIRGQVGQALANEMRNEFMNNPQGMMQQSYRQDGGSFSNPYANADTGITGNNENLSMQMQYGGLRKAQYGDEGSSENDAFWAGNPTEDRGAALQYNTKMQCTPEQKMIPGTECYDEAFATNRRNFDNQAKFPGMKDQKWDPNYNYGDPYTWNLRPENKAFLTQQNQQSNPNVAGIENSGYSTPQGSFDAQGNQTADAYGKMPEAPSPYFSSQPPSYGQELVGATPQQDVGTWDMNNPNAPQAPKVQTFEMDPNQMRTQEPKTTKKGKSYDWTKFMPNGIDQANKILGTMDFVTNRLEARENKKQEKENAWRYSGAVLEARPEMSSSRGDYSKNSGIFRSDQYVPVQFPGTNYGNVGTNQYAQMGGGFNEGEDVYMSDEDIQQYLAAGGQLEILD